MTPHIIQLPKIPDPRGNLTFIEQGVGLPFAIERCYWIYDIPAGETRGSHAMRSQSEVIIALAGSFDVLLDDGNTTTLHRLDRPYTALLVPPLTWRTLENFSSCSVAMVIASGVYDPGDYITDIAEFKRVFKFKSN